MRRSTRLAALTLGLVFLLGLTPSLVVAQDEGTPPGPVGELDPAAPGIYVSRGTSGPALGATTITFDGEAFIPEKAYPAVFVKVLYGTFAFRVQGDVIVDPQDDDLTVLEATPPIGIATPPASTHEFNPVGTVFRASCPYATPSAFTALCLINPGGLADAAKAAGTASLGEYFVELTQGQTVYIPEGTECFICNTTEIPSGAATPASTATPASLATPASTDHYGRGQLLMWTAKDFDWTTFVQNPPQGPATPSAHGGSGVRALLLNPGSPCHG
jgi:hypothetical protein